MAQRAPVPSNAAFLARYPSFGKCPIALLESKLAEAARRTSGNLYGSALETEDAVCLQAAVLLTKSPEARAMRLVDDDAAVVWASELYVLARGAGMGIRVF